MPARIIVCAGLALLTMLPLPIIAAGGNGWIAQSNMYTQMLLDIDLKHQPEAASGEGLARYDTEVVRPTPADQDQARHERQAVIGRFKAALRTEKRREVAQDLRIMIDVAELGFKREDFARAHQVSFLNASSIVFSGLRVLLDEQTPAERRAAAVVRIRKYAGLEAGYRPLTDMLKERVTAQMARPGVSYPSRRQIETELARNAAYVDGIAALMTKYKLAGWEQPFATLKAQLADYDAWMTSSVLPKARDDFRLPPEQYALALRGYGIDIPPAQIAAMAHEAFTEIQGEMKPIAVQISKQRHLPSSDYRNVIRELKKEQIVGEAILPLYTNRLKEIERIIVDHHIVTLPDRPARIRIATAAETAQQPAPYMVPPPFLNNTGQKGEFVLPLNLPAGPNGQAAEKYDDFTFDAAAWTLTAHEARPGHELQFDAMLERGVSLARVEYAFNSTNAEGWGLYAEYLIEPYMPLEGQLVSLDYRLLRAARAFLDPELQAGTVRPEDAFRVLENDVVQSHAFAAEEVERYTYRAPGQANSYFYGYTKLLEMRQAAEAALGTKFDQEKYHDFILSQGLLPPGLMRKAVMEDFVAPQTRH